MVGDIKLPWHNDDLVLYHGCSNRSLQPTTPTGILLNSPNHGITATVGKPNRDFGLGFYATSMYLQACSWANLVTDKLILDGHAAKAVVLQFSVKREELAKLESLVFVTEFHSYWPFVAYCRGGGAMHGRTPPAQEYDIVYGPLSLWEQPMVVKDADQVSFHTTTAIQAIPEVFLLATGTPFLPLR